MAILAGAVSLTITAEVTRGRAERNATRDLGELLDTVESTVRIACFVKDRELAAEVARGLLKNSKVLGVTIRAGERELARSYRLSPGAAETFQSEEEGESTRIETISALGSDRRLIRHVFSPFDAVQTVGEIVLDPDPAAISMHAAGDVRFVGMLFGLQWLVVGGGLLALVLLNVVRPIQTISAHLHEMDAEKGEQLTVPEGQKYTEIGRLVEDINALASRLVAAISRATGQAQLLRKAMEQVDSQSRQLEAKNMALARAMQVQEEVERIARHDLKTPLNSIAAIPALLRKSHSPSAQEESLLSMIENSARRVLKMVSLSLDLFRMEEGSYSFSPKVVDISALTNAVLMDLSEEAVAKNIEFQVSGSNPPVFVHAEEILCYSILANLVKNAVEAAPEGGIVTLSIQLGESVRIQIHNAGAVPLPVRASFFEKYATFGKSRGTGLGTYSARLMARIQRGDLTMITSDDAGTTLELFLPPPPIEELNSLCGAKEFGGITDSSISLSAQYVLLVDDDPDNTLIMRLFLPSPPLEVVTAVNGHEAVELCRIRRPDVIFMDLEMPVMGGFEAHRRIRALQAERGEIPSKIVAFSAHDDDDSRLRSVAAGFDMHLSKPTSQNEILRLLSGAEATDRDASTDCEALQDATVWIDEDLIEAIPGFLESRRALVLQLRVAIQTVDQELTRQLAHKLKGGFSMYGFKWAAQVAREIEISYLTTDQGSLSLHVDALEQHLARVKVRPRSRTGRYL